MIEVLEGTKKSRYRLDGLPPMINKKSCERFWIFVVVSIAVVVKLLGSLLKKFLV